MQHRVIHEPHVHTSLSVTRGDVGRPVHGWYLMKYNLIATLQAVALPFITADVHAVNTEGVRPHSARLSNPVPCTPFDAVQTETA